MKFSRHPETALTPLIRGELDEPERVRVTAHLERCAQCREQAAALAATLETLRVGLAAAPPPDWTVYRAQLRRRMAAAQSSAAGDRRRLPWRALIPLGVGAGMAAALALAVILRKPDAGQSVAPPPDQLAAADELQDADLDLMRNYPVVAHLDMLENYDVIEHLDELPAPPPGGHETSSS